MGHRFRISIWTAFVAGLAVTPVLAGPSGGLSGLSNGMADVHRSIGNGDFGGASSALGGLFDAGGGKFHGGAPAVAAESDSHRKLSDPQSVELLETAKAAWAGSVPPPSNSAKEGDEATSMVPRILARLSSDIVRTVIIVEQQLETATEKAAKAVEDEGAKRAREGAEKQREAEKKWEGKERNYPQYEKEK